MFSHDLIEEYTNTICQQIRWKKARFRVSEEMTNHIVDLRNLYMEQGTDEETATKKAIAETGDAVTIGIQFDRIHRPKLQWGMLLATAILLIFGILVRLFIFNDEDRIGLISIRLICTGIGIAGLLAAYFTDFTIIGKYPKITYISITSVSIILIILSRKINSMKFYAGYVQYIVLLFPLAFSAIVFVLRNKGYLGIILCGLVYTFSCYVAFYISSISGLLHFLIIGTTILLIAIYKKWFGLKKIYGFLVFIPSVLMTCLLFLQLQSYGAWERLKIIFNPASDLRGAGYIVMMIKKLINGAVFFGRGNIPEEYLTGLLEPYPFYYSELLLTALISLLGWIAFIVILSVLLFFAIKGFILCFKQKSSLGLFVSFAIMMTFCMQVFTYVVYNLGFFFITPISLPLISYGNTAMIINLVLIGFMLSVFRTGDVVRDKKYPDILKNNNFISWSDGKLTFNFKFKTQ